MGQIVSSAEDDVGNSARPVGSTAVQLSTTTEYFVPDSTILRALKATAVPFKLNFQSENGQLFQAEQENVEKIGLVKIGERWESIALHVCSTVSYYFMLFSKLNLQFFLHLYFLGSYPEHFLFWRPRNETFHSTAALS